jgi:AcrR family transcriptional regulator
MYHVSTVVPPRKRRADAELNRGRILESAVRLYRELGPHVSLDAIAAHAGVGSATLYRNFATRSDLRTAVLRARLAQVAAFLGTLDDEDDAWLAFESYARFLTSFADNTLVDVLVVSPAQSPDIAEARDALRPLVQHLIARAQGTGALRADYTLEELNVFVYAHTKVLSEPLIAPADAARLLDHYLEGLRP